MPAPHASPSTAREAADELEQVVDRAAADGSRNGYFAAMYLTVTRSIEQGIAAGFFDDGERMDAFTAAFAGHYFAAVAARDAAGEEPPRCWQTAFETAERYRPIALQHLLLGINAHINLDLGIATAETARGGELAALRGDYDRINEILAAVMDSVRDRLGTVSPWLGLIERLRLRHDDVLLRFSLEAARAHAWWFAIELDGLDREQWAGPIKSRDQRIAALGRRVARPGWLSAVLVPIRLRESNDAAAVIEVLRGTEPADFATLEQRLRDRDGDAGGARQG